ncbi:MAG: AMP-binding protein, partial [Sporichthyaceae bacterium]
GKDLADFYAAIGMPLHEGYGLTEGGIVALNPIGRCKSGSIGKALDGVEIRLAEDGELIFRSPSMFSGYYNDPQATEAVLRDGWLHTGDIAEIDADGYVTIVDRKKELIINAAGKNMSPANIEQKLKASSPLIGQACVIGDARPYNVALLVLDPDGTAAYAKAHGLAADPAVLCTDPGVLKQIDEAVETANARMSRVEQIKKFAVLANDWLPDGDELTPTMKLKRRGVAAKYAEQIEALYA